MRNAFRIFRRDMKRLLRNPAAILVLIGVSILPSLYAWFNIAANIDPYANAFNDGAVGGEWMSDLTDMKPELHERKWVMPAFLIVNGYRPSPTC